MKHVSKGWFNSQDQYTPAKLYGSKYADCPKGYRIKDKLPRGSKQNLIHCAALYISSPRNTHLLKQ